MGKLTPAETVREHNLGQKAASEGRSRYWSEPWAYPFESDEHYEGRREAFEQGFSVQDRNLARVIELPKKQAAPPAMPGGGMDF